MILWVGLSSLDYIGHIYGPQSFETIDTLYHLDRDLHSFMRCIRRAIGTKDTSLYSLQTMVLFLFLSIWKQKVFREHIVLLVLH